MFVSSFLESSRDGYLPTRPSWTKPVIQSSVRQVGKNFCRR